MGHRLGLVAAETARFVATDSRKLNMAADRSCDLFEYFGLRTVADRYLLRHPVTRDVIETPVYFFLRVACGLSTAVTDALELFDLMATHRYLHVTPAERHLIQRLVAFFATGDSIVGNNLVLNLYQHINSPEARMYLCASSTRRRCTFSST